MDPNECIWSMHNWGKEIIYILAKVLDLTQEEDWMLLGDFNLYRVLENRNRPGTDNADMFLFNSTTSLLGLIEIPLQGKNSHGLTCNPLHSLKRLIGSSQILPGPFLSPTPPAKLWWWKYLITTPWSLPSLQLSPKFISLDLKIIGFKDKASIKYC